MKRPTVAVAGAAIAFAFLALPLAGLMARAPWSDVVGDLTTPESLDTIRLSLVCSAWATVVAAALGLPLAWVLARVPFPGR
ncbi:MAG TPA: molybdate ABC transporter permease subunit, partial [Acidimicrobiales bacterium]